jgi:hypothetical protein
MRAALVRGALLAAVALLGGCGAGEVPLQVELGANAFWGSPQLELTSLADEITVTDLTINRGNCKFNPHEPLPHTLVYGASFKVDSPSCQNVLEVSIDTDQGSYDFTFDESE